jgi:hypothetical protein
MINADIVKLRNIDDEDIGDLLPKIEKSYHFRFHKTDLIDVKTFGELCDIIVNKIQLPQLDDCTSQQAFYKLRAAICNSLGFTKENIHLTTELALLFPWVKRRENIKLVENMLGFPLNILRPKYWLTTSLALLFLTSFFCFFFNWQFGLGLLMLSIGGFYLSHKFGKDLDIATIRELVEKMSREHYLDSRRDAGTVNKKEVVKKITNLFASDLDLDHAVLTRDAAFN